jgi:hypothetical protein
VSGGGYGLLDPSETELNRLRDGAAILPASDLAAVRVIDAIMMMHAMDTVERIGNARRF